MKRLLIVIVLSITLLFSCTKPLDNIVILKAKDKGTGNADNTIVEMITNTSGTTTFGTYNSTDGATEKNEQPQVTTTVNIIDGKRLLIINKSSKKIHLSEECSYAGKILEANRLSAPYAELYSYLQNGYEICSYCEKHY